MPRVSARDNPRLVEAARLVASSRDRRKRGKCVLEGGHLVGVYLDRVGVPETLLVVEERAHETEIAALVARVPSRDVLVMRASLFADTVVAPADIAVAAVVPTPAPAIPPSARFHLLLEDIQDPGNVGTILRTGPRRAWIRCSCPGNARSRGLPRCCVRGRGRTLRRRSSRTWISWRGRRRSPLETAK